jgi:hypothetical protein
VTIEQSQEKSSMTAAQRAEAMYRGRHSSQPQDITGMARQSQGTVSTDFSPDRDIIQRVRYVFDQILTMLGPDAKKDMRFIAMKTMMYESLKDLARIPDEQIKQMTQDMANALAFVANGTMSMVEEYEEDDGDI